MLEAEHPARTAMECSNRFFKAYAFLLCAALVPCSPTHASPDRVPTAGSEKTILPASVAGLPGVSCTRQKKDWNYQCVYGNFEIATYPMGCGAHGFYGMVYATDTPAVTMQDEFPQGRVVAKLQEQQLVCTSAVAHVKGNNDAVWYYLTAIPRDSVKACKGKSECGPGNLQIEWTKPVQGATCHLGADGYYVACASGWVKAENFSEFSNGL
jgi:hypothetical protein